MSTTEGASGAGPIYRIVSRVHINQWVDSLQRAVAGWEIRAWWARTGTTIPIFVADDAYTPETVDAAIRAAGEKDEKIHGLGG